jgi:chromosome segregation ATPase
LQQIQAIITAAIAPLEQGQQQITARLDKVDSRLDKVDSRLDTLEKGQKNLETKISAIETRVEQSEQKILTKLDQLEKLSADYLDGRVQTVTRRVDHIEKHLHLTP